MITSDNRPRVIEPAPPATGVRFTKDRVYVELSDGREVGVPLTRFPRLKEATAEQRADWRLIGRGRGVHWPKLDEDIAVAHLLGQSD